VRFWQAERCLAADVPLGGTHGTRPASSSAMILVVISHKGSPDPRRANAAIMFWTLRFSATARILSPSLLPVTQTRPHSHSIVMTW